jgi:predicted Na+-dependent transporter
MNLLKRALGIVWIVLGPVILYWLIRTGAAEIAKNPASNTKIQWGVFIVIFIPIVVGLVLFGYYSLKGEYDNGK